MMVVLLAVPDTVTAAGGFVHAFHFSILLWPFNLVLPHSQLRHAPERGGSLRRRAARVSHRPAPAESASTAARRLLVTAGGAARLAVSPAMPALNISYRHVLPRCLHA
ncbi:hypothetical protein ACQ4PT_019855 [Festuca glaucescens]